MHLPDTQYSWQQDIFLLLIILSIFFGILAGTRPLSVPDEARYSEIPREMVVTGDYVTPRLNTIKYFEKPALFYWLQAGAIRLFGLSEWAMRLPTLLLGLIGCLATYVTARMLFNRQSGWIASIALATSILYFAMAHTITLDMAVSVLIMLCLSCFILAVDMPSGLRRKGLLYATYVFAALAMLTKGLVGVLLPAAIIGSWILLCNQWQILTRIQLFSGVCIFLAITVPWHMLVQHANTEFFHFYFIDQQFLRYLTLYAKRYQPDWFFIPVLLLGFFPWIAFVFQALRYHSPTTWQHRNQQKKPIFLMLWASIIFAFFSLSKSKLIPYILPVFPPLAMLAGHYIAAQLENPLAFRRPFLAILIGSLLISIVLPAIPYVEQVNNLNLSLVILSSMSIILFTGASVAWFYARRLAIKTAFFALLASMAIFLILANIAVGAVDTRSIKPLAMALKENVKPTDEIVSYQHYYQDLPFYFQRRVTVVDCRGELEFGMQHQNTSQFMISDANFWRRWHENKNVYAVMALDTYEALKCRHPDMYLLASTKDNVLVANKKS